MINQKKKHSSRVGIFGASDTHYIMSNWETSTFINWFQTKLGVKDNNFRNIYTIAGTYIEHRIADWYAEKYNVKIIKDRRVKVRHSKLIVNLDCETKDTDIEIKTYKITDKEWKVPQNYWEQVQVQMYATGKKGMILAYGLLEEDYDNFYLPIEEERIRAFEITYDKQWIENEYLPRLEYLSYCLKKRKTPNKVEFERRNCER